VPTLGSDSGRFSKADSADRFLIPVSSGGWVGGWVCGWVGVWVGGWVVWVVWVVWGGVGWCGVVWGWCGVVWGGVFTPGGIGKGNCKGKCVGKVSQKWGPTRTKSRRITAAAKAYNTPFHELPIWGIIRLGFVRYTPALGDEMCIFLAG
jgi:hypothetical protein